MKDVILEAKHIFKRFFDPHPAVILNDITFCVNKGEFVAVTGKSGCGKSTLLYILSTMDTTYEGQLVLDGEIMNDRKEEDLARVRNEKIGFVFQFHYLLNEFSVLRNVMLPGLKLNKEPVGALETKAQNKLSMLGLQHLSHKRPNQLSGGEKQRVAIARALMNDPDLIMADEPTGNLDKKNSQSVFEIFNQLAAESKQTLLVVTHDKGFAENTHRIIEMEDGRIIRQ